MVVRSIFLFMLFFLCCHFSFGKKKDKWILVKGTTVDTLGQNVPYQYVALINRKGNDKKLLYSNEQGQFSFKVKEKKISDYSIKCYSYSPRNKTKLVDFINNNQLVLNTKLRTDHIKMYYDRMMVDILIRDSSFSCSMPIQNFLIRTKYYHTHNLYDLTSRYLSIQNSLTL